jgi:hypothetical protein
MPQAYSRARRGPCPIRCLSSLRHIGALFTVAGGFVTARLAPDRPMRHAWILAGIGLAAGLAGVAFYFIVGGAQLGPAWYPVSIAVEAIPCVWFGGRLAAGVRSR